MSIELILLSVNINFIAFSAYINDISGQILQCLHLLLRPLGDNWTSHTCSIFRNLGSIEVNKLISLRDSRWQPQLYFTSTWFSFCFLLGKKFNYRLSNINNFNPFSLYFIFLDNIHSVY